MSYSETSTPQVAGQQYSKVVGSAIDGVDRAQVVGVGLYAATLACHWFAAAARWLVVTVVLGVTGWLTHWPIPTHLVAMVVSIGPLAASVLVLAFPRAVASAVARCWEILSGGRPPEEREIDAFESVVRRLQMAYPAVRMPMHWFIADCEGCGVEARCGCLRVDRGVLDSPYAAGVIAHALGHLDSLDARLSTAVRLLVLAPLGTPSVTPLRSLPLRGLAWVASGQAACWLLRGPWEVYCARASLRPISMRLSLGRARRSQRSWNR